MAREIIDNPPPLNGYRQFPYKITPFPFDWLQKFTTLDDAVDSDPAPTETLPTSEETWT